MEQNGIKKLWTLTAMMAFALGTKVSVMPFRKEVVAPSQPSARTDVLIPLIPSTKERKNSASLINITITNSLSSVLMMAVSIGIFMALISNKNHKKDVRN